MLLGIFHPITPFEPLPVDRVLQFSTFGCAVWPVLCITGVKDVGKAFSGTLNLLNVLELLNAREWDMSKIGANG